MNSRLSFTVCLLLLAGFVQSQPAGIRIEGTNIVLTLNNSLSKQKQQELLIQFGMERISLDSLWQFSTLGALDKEGWKLHKSAKGVLSIYKPVHSLTGNINKDHRYLPNDMRNLIEQQTRATFGINVFRKPSVIQLPNGKTRFYYEGLQHAGDIFLSGTFNEWSTLSTPMIRTDSGWVADLFLGVGKHCYKFIIDGHWVHDLSNKQQEDDGYEGSNSIYFVYNHTFMLTGFENAREVVVTGSFNDWNERQLKMRKTKEGWALPVYLKDATYTYKFIVDGNWITDPANTFVQEDGNGNTNSVLTKGDPHIFTLNGYKSAREVVLSGEFNNWNATELKMQKTESGWRLPFILSAGNYQYKFIVDGNWILDPLNPIKAEQGGEQNSLLSIKPTHSFIFNNLFTSAKEVKIGGNFSDWQGYTLEKTNNGWSIQLYVPTGKCLYKVLVDGEWIVDPTNPQWEENEFGTGNSVLWIRTHQ